VKRIGAAGLLACVVLTLYGFAVTRVASGAPLGIRNPNIILASGLAGPYVQYPVAVEKGFFEKYGLHAQLRIFASGFEGVQAVGSRAAHITNAGEFSLIVPRAKGADLVVVARNIVNTGDLGVGAVKGLTGPKDLVGKKCGAVLGGTGEWYVHRYEVVYGIDPKEITLVNLAAPEWLPAMARGDIQCFFGWEPWLTELPKIVAGAKVIHRNGKDGVYILQNYLGFSYTWVKEDPEGAKAALRAMIDTMNWVQVNRQEAAAIAARVFQMKPNELASLMDCCVYKVDFPQQLVDAAVEMSKWAASRGIVEMNPDRLVSTLLFPSLMKTVAPDRCTAGICKKITP